MSALDRDIKNTLGYTRPLAVLNRWLKQACKIKGIKEPWAMVLSTSYKRKASSRVVLLKKVNQGRLIFYTNYLSEKGRDIAHSSWTAVNFYWPQLSQQIRIEGKAQKLSRKQSVLYWKTRSRSSQLSQWISKQSQEAESRQQLKNLKKAAERRFKNKEIPCPKNWGGYAVSIQKIEFWKNRDHRLHDRFLFKKKGSGWEKQRLFP